jgi:hypothetical protein
MSVFFGIAAQFAPIPENWRWSITVIAGVGFVVSFVGWCLSYYTKQLKVTLVPWWGAPQVATIVNRNPDYPAHVKRSTLYGIRWFARERLYEASKFRQCPPAPFTIEANRQIEQAYGGYIPFEQFRFLQVEIELENKKTFVSRKVRSPSSPVEKSRQNIIPEPEAAPADDETPASTAFEIGAVTTSDLQNLTERGYDAQGKPSWRLDCEIKIHNLNLTQGVNDVRFRLLNITPPMPASPRHHPRTQDTTLRRVRYGFTDLSPGEALLGDETAHVRIFNATRHVEGRDTVVHVNFYGEWPDNLGTAFAPEAEHLITVEVTGSGVRRREATFRMLFSAASTDPVLTIVDETESPGELTQAEAEAAFLSCVRKIRKEIPPLKALQEVDSHRFFKTTKDLVEFGNNVKLHTGVNPCEELPVPQENWLAFLRFSDGFDLSTNEGMDAACRNTLALPHRVEEMKAKKLPRNGVPLSRESQ